MLGYYFPAPNNDACIFSLSLLLRLVSDLPGRSPPRMNPLAPSNMTGIRRSLTLDAAVPIQMAITAPLGGNSDLVGAGGVGTGLGGPVAAGAFTQRTSLNGAYLLCHARGSQRCKHPDRTVIEATVARYNVAFRTFVKLIRCAITDYFRGNLKSFRCIGRFVSSGVCNRHKILPFAVGHTVPLIINALFTAGFLAGHTPEQKFGL